MTIWDKESPEFKRPTAEINICKKKKKNTFFMTHLF